MVFVNFLLKDKLRNTITDGMFPEASKMANMKQIINHPSSIALHLAASCSQTSPRCHGIKIMSPPYLPVKPTQQVLVSPSNLWGDQVLTLSIIAVGMRKRLYHYIVPFCTCLVFAPYFALDVPILRFCDG